MSMEGSNLLNAKTILQTVGVGNGQVVGDLGCGAKGYFSLQAAKMGGDKGIIYACDVVKTALESVESRARMEGIENLTTVWTNLEISGATKIQDGRLDVALIFNILYQSDKRSQIMEEAIRLVTPGGKIAIVDWRKGAGPLGPLEKERVDLKEIQRLASSLGLQEEQTFEAGPYHFGAVFIKPA